MKLEAEFWSLECSFLYTMVSMWEEGIRSGVFIWRHPIDILAVKGGILRSIGTNSPL